MRCGATTVSYPLVSGYEALEDYGVPDPELPGRCDEADRKLLDRSGRCARAVAWFTLLERLWMLRGFENILVDPYLHEREFSMLRDRVVEYDLAIIDRWIERHVDDIFFSDD